MDLKQATSILLISCYELGHQPMGVAMPAAFLRRAGYTPELLDIAIQQVDDERLAAAKLIGISVPMHTALRLGVHLIERIRAVNSTAHICCYGLYAALNADYLLDHGADSCIGGEYEALLVALVEGLSLGAPSLPDGVVLRGRSAPPQLQRLAFVPPARDSLPALDKYAQLEHRGARHLAGYAEATRGCLHLCTHCPIPPVYGGRFFALPQDVVLEDIRRQAAAGATHISFGDPDFLNGPAHSLRIVRKMHHEFPELTFDFTAKIEHLLLRQQMLAEFANAGCLFIISAVESLSDRVLSILDKRHTRAQVLDALRLVHATGIVLRPTWVAFTPWTTLDDYREMLEFVETEGLIDHIDPVQYAVRLLIPPGSWLADHPQTLPHRGPLNAASFSYSWAHPDPRMDRLFDEVSELVQADELAKTDPARTFYRLVELANGRQPANAPFPLAPHRPKAPRMTETWFC